MESFGDRLKKLRNKRGITQEKLAMDLDIPESSIRRLEISKGVPRMDRLKQIASYFNVTVDDLLGRETKIEVHRELTEIEKINEETAEYLKMAKNVEQAKLVRDLAKTVFKNEE